MQMTINNAEIVCACACGHEDIAHIEESVAFDDLEAIVEAYLEYELGWYGGECPDCAENSMYESRGCDQYQQEREEYYV
jgi:hypothetical protein